MSDPSATIAIPTYNRAALLKKLLECMLTQDTQGKFSYEILIVDDASTDATHEVVRDAARNAKVPLRYIRESGQGYTHALNRSVHEFRGQWLAFFDDDQITHRSWLYLLLDAARDQKAKMVGGPIVLDLPEDVLQSLGPVCRDLFGESPDVRNPDKFRHRPPLPSGGNRLIHRSVFSEIGGFDERMVTGGCDRDFLLRARDHGIPMGWARKAVARHIIDRGRLKTRHIKWYSLQWGCAFAYTDWKQRGRMVTCLSCVGRIFQALFLNMPRYLYSKATGNRADVMDRYALLWRASGYTRKTLQLLAPAVFPQEEFFSKVEFRRVRDTSKISAAGQPSREIYTLDKRLP